MKKLQRVVLSFCLVLSLLFYPNIEANASNVSLGVSNSEINIGDTVTVSVTVPDTVSATVDLSYSSKVLSFVSASADVGSNGGTITMNIGKYSLAASNTISVTFKAATSGTANLSASVVSAVDNDTAEEVSLGGASTSVEVENKEAEQPETPPSETPDTPSSEQPETPPSETPDTPPSETPKSQDNSLSSLKLSSGRLSPKFQYNVTKYTATVGYNVSSVVVSAKTSNEKATIESVTGNGNVKLDVGENTIQVVVQAENGVKATYTIVVTREEGETTPDASESESNSNSEGESESEQNSESESENSQEPDMSEMFQWNGQNLQPAGNIPKDLIPTDFSKNSVMINSVEIPCLVFENGDLKVLYLANEEGTAGLYVYEEAQQLVYPFVKLQSNDNYVIVLLPDESNAPTSENYKPCTLSIEGKGVINAYQFMQSAENTETTSWFAPEEFFAAESVVTDFYLIYGMNHIGEIGWYVYDSVEGTVQRYLGSVHNPALDMDAEAEVQTEDVPGAVNNQEYDALAAKLKQAENMQMIILCAAIFVVVALVIIVVNLILRSRSDESYDEYEDDGDEYDEEYEFEEENTIEETDANVEDADEEIEIEFYEMPQEAAVSDESEAEGNDEEIEIEFYKMPQEKVVFDESEAEGNDEEIEIEFYEMPQEEIVSDESEAKENDEEETKDDDKVEVEFYDMEELLMKEAFADEEEPSKNEEKIPENNKQPLVSEFVKNENIYTDDDDDDDDLEFIELD